MLGPCRAARAHLRDLGAFGEPVRLTPLPAKSPLLRTGPPASTPSPHTLLEALLTMPLSAVPGLTPLGEAAIENGPVDSIRIQSP